MTVIEDPGEHWSAANPATVVDRTDGRVWLLYLRCRSGRRPGLPVTPVACAIERYTSRAAGDDRDRLLWTGPRGPGRRDLVVRISYDEGRTFPVERLVAAGPAAYSDLSILKDRSVGVL